MSLQLLNIFDILPSLIMSKLVEDGSYHNYQDNTDTEEVNKDIYNL